MSGGDYGNGAKRGERRTGGDTAPKPELGSGLVGALASAGPAPAEPERTYPRELPGAPAESQAVRLDHEFVPVENRPRKKQVRALAHAALEALGESFPLTIADADRLETRLRRPERPATGPEPSSRTLGKGETADGLRLRSTRTTDDPRDDLRRWLEGYCGRSGKRTAEVVEPELVERLRAGDTDLDVLTYAYLTARVDAVDAEQEAGDIPF